MSGSNEQSYSHKYVSGSDAYVPLPPMLLNTAGLEIYLQNLNQKLHLDLAELKKEINTSREEVTAAFVSVNQMKRYLGERAMAEMKGVIKETSNVLEQFHHSTAKSGDKNNNSNEFDSTEGKTNQNTENELGGNVFNSNNNRSININVDDQVSGVRAWYLNASSKMADDNVISEDATNKEQTESVDTFEGMMMVAKELMNENRELRKALIKSAEMNEETERLHAQLYANLAQSNERMSRFQHDFNKLSEWLGTCNMFDLPQESSTVNTSDKEASLNLFASSTTVNNTDIKASNIKGSSWSMSAAGGVIGASEVEQFQEEEKTKQHAHTEINLPSPEEVETFLARSPLLLTFRRILLRDLGLRLAHNTEIQSRDVGETISNLKQNINDCVTPQRVLAMINNTQDNKANELMRNFADRLKAIESNYVTRDEYVTSIGTKADSLMMPIKADSTVVSELSRQLNDRCVNLEERLAYFEAERNELRKIVKALLAERQSGALELSKSHELSSMLGVRQGNTNVHTESGGNSSPFIQSHGALFLPYHTSSVNAQGNRLRNGESTVKNNNNSSSVNEGQLYRLLHPDKKSPERITIRPEFVTAKVSSSSLSRLTSNSPFSSKEQNTSARKVHEPNTKYFAEEFNKEQVESLPALPYVRSSHS